MFEDIQIEANNRLTAARVLCDKVSSTPATDAMEEMYNNTCKGMFFVVLYGALEYTLTSVVSATIQTINDRNINFDLLKPRLLSLSLDSKCEAIRNGRNKRWLKQHELFTTFENPTAFEAETSIFPAERGNIKYKQIAFMWEVFGLSAPVLPENRYQGLFEPIAENRMKIAHGRFSPQEVGRQYSKNDIVTYHDNIKNYCSYVFTCFENYCVNREYER